MYNDWILTVNCLLLTAALVESGKTTKVNGKRHCHLIDNKLAFIAFL